jgi:hypothetical protein
LDLAHEYWAEEHTRLIEKCEEVDIERAALDEGAILWNDVVKQIISFETSLQDMMQQKPRSLSSSKVLENMLATIKFLEEKSDFVREREWNLLFIAINAELEAFKQGKDMLEDALGVKKSKKGKEKVVENLVDTNEESRKSPKSAESAEEEISRSAIRIPKDPKELLVSSPKPSFFDTDNEDPDPDLMISHQDTDTD